ncbi:MAG TPA: glycosyltransferase family 4 protein [Kamptonema sp.]|nr:glycosyltransferase family 4 protein [Kamptonema sp.]
MKKPSCVICCTQFFAQTLNWLTPVLGEDQVHWYVYDFGPLSQLKRLRACFQTAYSAKQNRLDLLIANDPRETFWCAFFAALLGVSAKQIACAFNFPILPSGLKRRLYTLAFAKIEQFVVYSKVEKQIYSEYFGIPLERIEVILWGVATPEVHPEAPLETGDYICAIGGNARDYPTLIKAIEKLPEIPLVLVVRPDNLEGLIVPKNVKVLINISPFHALNILKYSRFTVLPLKGSQAPCGHVTLVWTMQLGKAFIITNSQGISDYAIPNYNCLTCEPYNADALNEAIFTLWNDPERCQKLGENGCDFAGKYCTAEAAQEQLQHLLLDNLGDS